MDIKLRKAVQVDVHEIARIHVNSWKVAFAGLISERYINRHTYSSRVDEWSEIIKTNAETVVVAENKGKMVGFMSYSAHFPFSKILTLNKLYLCPSVFGRKLGSQLMSYLTNQAKALGITTIYLYVLDSNGAAIVFYSKQGFVFSNGYLSKEFEGECIVNLLMTKRV